MDEVLETVNGYDLAFSAFVRATDYENFVVFPDGDAADLFCGKLELGGDFERDAAMMEVLAFGEGPGELTLCLSRSSLLRGALMMVLRTLEGALK